MVVVAYGHHPTNKEGMNMSASTVDWGAPPPVQRGQRKSKYDPIVEELKQKPGKFALVMQNVNSASAKVLTQRGCKITTRSTGAGDSRVNVWAMWPEDAPQDEDAEATDVQVKARPKKMATKAKATKAPAAGKLPRARKS